MADEKQPQAPLTPLDEKILRVLSDRVILKPLTRWNEAYKEFPRFVMEYLVSRYVDAANPVAGQHKIDKILTEHYSESAKKELIKSRIKERGQYTLLGQLTVVTAEYRTAALSGVIGVIGPTRMPYEKIVSIVTHTSRLVTALLD